jgi:transcriptional regulator with XRE-family HTH domain
MSPDDLQRLRRRFGLTQVQFADLLGISPALVASLECGRRRITERRIREIARLFEGELYNSRPVPLVQGPGSLPRVNGSDRPAIAPPPSRSATASSFVQPWQPASPAISRRALGPVLPPVVTWSTCRWRDPTAGPCGASTPQGMLYCAVHMAIALIEGRPTRTRL